MVQEVAADALLPEIVDALDLLYNEHVKRFYSSPEWRHRFAKRLWQHRWSLWYLMKHLPSFAQARKNFEPGEES